MTIPDNILNRAMGLVMLTGVVIIVAILTYKLS